MRRRPRIGLTTSHGFDGATEEQRLDRRYVRALQAAGAAPIILPFDEDGTLAGALGPLLDALLIPGGPGLELGLVGTLPPELPPVTPARFHSDRRWLRAALHRGLPVLGICYGMQLLNAELGGTLYADTERQHPGARPHSPQRGASRHPIDVAPGTTLAAFVGAGRHEVNSRHLQSPASPGRGLEVSARADDGSIEALEGRGGRLLGLQWHPEALGDAASRALFAGFVARLR